ncbi:MAG: murein biosynthesis integral membrane protein MurJ [Deltaproteobacteria bacterium]|nr:murein biosynthesis integral membrane protein MurJ [Deltaproteobacteria bacterium]MBW2071264.1 murein biosynthesis integral membrane protein MurJ [Deltaproteobacteria bacterium]
MRKPFSTKFFEMVRGNLISRVFGFLREVVVAFYFGASRATDVFAIAFTIPTLFRRILGEDMVEKAFLPSFRQLVAAGHFRRAWLLARRTFFLMVGCLLLLMALCYLFAPNLVGVIGAGLDVEGFEQAKQMTYYVLPFMLVIGLAAFTGGLLLFLDATGVYAFAPVFLSVGVILGIVVFKPFMGMYSIALGFVLGALLQLFFQVPFLVRAARRNCLHIESVLRPEGESLPELREVGRQSGWIFLQSLASKTVEVVDRLLASFLVPGSVAALYFAQRLVQVPNAVLGLSVGRAGVTDLNDQVQKEDWQGFRCTVVKAIRYNISTMLPVTVFIVSLSAPITAIIFQRGAFGSSSVQLTSLAFALYGLGLLGMSIWSLYTRIFPALARNEIPLYTSLLCALLNVALSLLLVHTPLKHGGLALASSIAFTVNALLLFLALNGELRKRGQRAVGWQDLRETVLSIALASAMGGLIAWGAYGQLHSTATLARMPVLLFHWGEVIALGAALGAGGLAFLCCLGYWGSFHHTGGLLPERVILTGGGTGGHVNPALAIAESIKEQSPAAEFLYVGVQGRAESVIVTRAGYPIRYVRALPFPGLRPSWSLVRFVLALLQGVVHSFWLIATFRPNLIIGTGGYASAPLILANTFMRAVGMSRARVIIHEQNSVPGKLNHLIGRRADQVLLTFPQTKHYFPRNSAVVGYPVRRSVTDKAGSVNKEKLPFAVPAGRRVVFVFGGSQGARAINRAVVDALGHLGQRKQEIFIIHGVGLMNGPQYYAWEDTSERLHRTYDEAQRQEIASYYYAQDYFHNIGDIYAISDLVVCRGGAGSLNEISAMGKPALIIPKANLPGDHQVMNARAMSKAGAAEIIYEDTVIEEGALLERVDGKELAARILSLLDAPERLERMAACSRNFMKQDALQRIMSEIYHGNQQEQPSGEEPTEWEPPLLGNEQLLARLQQVRQQLPERYHPKMVVPSPDDLEYYRHRAASLLAAPHWQERNLGVKLIGLLKHAEKLPSLLYLLTERKPVSRLQRLFGGDYQQVGFIRRNILTALQMLDVWDSEIEARVLESLEDGYYEVRAQAARTMAHFADRLNDRRLAEEKLLALLADPSFEVVLEAALALGKVADDEQVAEQLLELQEHHYWQVRNAALRSVAALVERGVIRDRARIQWRVESFILTMTDFRPHFAIKETYRRLISLCRDNSTENDADAG